MQALLVLCLPESLPKSKPPAPTLLTTVETEESKARSQSLGCPLPDLLHPGPSAKTMCGALGGSRCALWTVTRPKEQARQQDTWAESLLSHLLAEGVTIVILVHSVPTATSW